MNVVARTLAAAAVLALLAPAATAQDRDWWREMAARDAERAREAQRAELIRAQYERRRSMAHARIRSGEAGTLYASTPSTAEAQLSCQALPVEDTPSVFDRLISERSDGTLLITLGNGRPTTAGGRDAGTAPPYWPETLMPVSPQDSPAWDLDAIHGEHMLSENPGATATTTAPAHGLPFLPSAADARGRQGIAHILNRSAEAGEVHIVAVDDSGRRYGPLTLSIGANGTAQVTSTDLENGNADRGLIGATGPGVGDWRLEFSSDLDIEARSFVRASDGLLTAMHDVAPSEGGRHRVPLFSAASNVDQESRLRLINPGTAPAEVAIAGIDSRGASPGDGVTVTLPAGASATYTAAELESGRGAGLQGSLGDGTGEWRLIVESEQPLGVMSLVSSPTGHMANLSTAPSSATRGMHQVPLFPATSDPWGRQGLVRVVNRTNTAGEVRVKAHDDTRWDYAPLVLPIGAGETVTLNSNDLEQGNPAKGVAGGTGSGHGDWRLELTSDVDIEVLSYVRAWDGVLTPMHDIVSSEVYGTRHRVAMFDPESSPDREPVLRLINPGGRSAEVAISGIDARGGSLGDDVTLTVPAGASVSYTAAQLQTGAGLRGSLGGAGEWRLTLESDRPLQVMSLLSSSTGHLSNLSTAPVSIARMPPAIAMDTETPDAQTPEDVFRTDVSGIVQSKCVICHVAGGASGEGVSRLQFSPSTVEDHVALNLAVFEALIAVLAEDEEIEDPVAYVLNKVQGVGHGGGVQAAAGTDDYASLDRFLGLLGGAAAPVAITPETLFAGVTMESPRQTLRRAAIVFAGRAPTQAEYAAVEGGGEEALRTAVRALMTGPGFHEFLIRASNDRLLTDRLLRGHTIENNGYFVDFDNEFYRLAAMEDQTSHTIWRERVQYGAGRAPLELIAHVVENDLPYTEILTADYIMANPWAAQAYGASTMFDNPNDPHRFEPSRIENYYRRCEGYEAEFTPGIGVRVLDPGPCNTNYPHAGILNTTVFLKRYPTTATNRNRARSRWTYYHFLGVDIEKSASRTTDPIALADTNNPTMQNPACTVCHNVMDPVAGAFQNYGDVGFYRDQHGGKDSLDEFYKDPPGEQFEINATSREERETISAQLFLTRESRVLVSTNYGRDWTEGADRTVALDSLVITDSEQEEVYRVEFEDLDDHECGWLGYNEATGNHDHWIFNASWTGCRLRLPIEIPADGAYKVGVVTWSEESESDERLAELQLAATPYREGDSWYRDMVAPGLGNQLAPNPENSLQWLAQYIVADERFAEATVKFWWPAIMGVEIAEPPEDESDADFEGLLLASNAQAAEVTRLADGFRSGFHDRSPYNLKDLLAEIVLSQWFRAESLSENDPMRAIGLGGTGARRLLTPEELARKTLALTGFQWGRDRGHNWRAPHERNLSLLTDQRSGYGLLYGGIDSDGITERARDLTPVMAGIAQSHALQSSYPIVMRELYLLPVEQRRLFGDVDIAVTPIIEFGETFEIESDSWTDKELLSVTGRLSAGPVTVSMSFPNDYARKDPPEDRNIRLDRLDVRNASGGLVHTVELENLEALSECNYPVNDHFALHCSGSLNVPIEVPVDGEYAIEVVAWADQGGDELPILAIALNSGTENSFGANRIKSKLVELYDTLHGISVTADSAEVQDAYALFVEVWERKRGAYSDHFLYNEENIRNGWPGDDHFFDGIADHLWRQELNENGNELGWDWDAIGDFFDEIDWSDPHAVARTWTVVLAYLMMDYRYLYL